MHTEEDHRPADICVVKSNTQFAVDLVNNEYEWKPQTIYKIVHPEEKHELSSVQKSSLRETTASTNPIMNAHW